MSQPKLPRWSGRARAAAALVALTAAVPVAMPPARAETVASGPVFALGFTSKLRNDLVIPTLGWRWRLSPGATIAGWGERVGTDLSFVVEPTIGAIAGDKDSVEAQILPLLHVRPARMRDRAWSPYLEGGVGLIYTGLEGLRLGSNVLFSDDVGAGVWWRWSEASRWSRVGVGYRYRHISHAGIFGSPNSGMNTHYLTVTIE
jgi:hypothetical protein